MKIFEITTIVFYNSIYGVQNSNDILVLGYGSNRSAADPRVYQFMDLIKY